MNAIQSAQAPPHHSRLVCRENRRLRPVSRSPFATSPYASGSLRYLAVVSNSDGTRRLFCEAADPDGSHSLYTEPVAGPGATGITSSE